MMEVAALSIVMVNWEMAEKWETRAKKRRTRWIANCVQKCSQNGRGELGMDRNNI